MLKTSKAAPLATANVVTKGAALPKLKTAETILKKTSRIFPTEYSGSFEFASGFDNVQPYQKPKAYAAILNKIINY